MSDGLILERQSGIVIYENSRVFKFSVAGSVYEEHFTPKIIAPAEFLFGRGQLKLLDLVTLKCMGSKMSKIATILALFSAFHFF